MNSSFKPWILYQRCLDLRSQVSWMSYSWCLLLHFQLMCQEVLALVGIILERFILTLASKTCLHRLIQINQLALVIIASSCLNLKQILNFYLNHLHTHKLFQWLVFMISDYYLSCFLIHLQNGLYLRIPLLMDSLSQDSLLNLNSFEKNLFMKGSLVLKEILLLS